MAKEIYWYGDGDGDQGSNLGKWNYNINWRLTSDGSASTVPAAGDTVHVDNRAYYNTTDERYQDIKDGMTGAETNTPDLASFHVKANYDGYVGLTSEYLELECSAGDIIFEGTAAMYLSLSAGAEADADSQRLILNSSGGALYLSSFVNNDYYRGLYSQIIAISGTLYLGNTAAVEAAFYELIVLSATVIIGTYCFDDVEVDDLPGLVKQYGGIITSNSPIKQYLGTAGTFNWGTALAAAIEGFDCDLIELYGSCTFNWSTKDATVSILKQFKLFGGTLNASLSTNAESPKQIGTGTEVSEIWTGATARFNNGNQNIAIESGSSIKSHGGTLIPPDVQSLTW